VAEEKIWRSTCLCQLLMDFVQVIQDLLPIFDVCAGTIRPTMTPHVDHLEGETSLGEVPGQSRVSATVFQDTMHTEDPGTRLSRWLPAPAPQLTTIGKHKKRVLLSHVANPSVVHQGFDLWVW